MRNQRFNGILLAAGVLGALGVAVGAYASHGLESFLLKQDLQADVVAEKLAQCEIAVRYQMLHAVALLTIGCVSRFTILTPKALLSTAAAFWILGVCLFSGGLYSMVFLDRVGHWAIVPLGGLSFIAGWLTVALAAILWPQQDP